MTTCVGQPTARVTNPFMAAIRPGPGFGHAVGTSFSQFGPPLSSAGTASYGGQIMGVSPPMSGTPVAHYCAAGMAPNAGWAGATATGLTRVSFGAGSTTYGKVEVPQPAGLGSLPYGQQKWVHPATINPFVTVRIFYPTVDTSHVE